jgi:hypothetical protein
MRPHDSAEGLGSLEAWLAGIADASRTLVEHAVGHVDRLVEDVLADATDVARRAADLFDDLVASLDERDPG